MKITAGKRTIMIVFCLLCLLCMYGNKARASSSEWQKKDGEWYYFDQNGEKVTGWKTINGSTYLFDQDGKMVTGWYKEKENCYCYLDPENNGKMVTGWKDIGSDRYYFSSYGYMMLDGWKQIEGKYYAFDQSGKMRTGWFLDGNWYFYLDLQDGYAYTGWHTIGTDQYFFDEKGYLIHGRGAVHKLSLYDTRYDRGPLMVGYFEVDESIPCYCIMHDVQPPTQKGRMFNTSVSYTCQNQKNEVMRKIFYYGYGGPGQIEGIDPRTTALAASVANGHSDNVQGRGKKFIQKLSDFPPAPKEFIVYVLTDGSSQTQDLAYWRYRDKPDKTYSKIKIRKISANSTVTESNAMYSLKNAQFGVYTDAEAEKSRMGTLVTDVEGVSNFLTLEKGIYYVKEERAPSGYALNQEIKKVDLNKQENVVVTFKDVPQMNPVSILVRKTDDETKKGEPEGYGTFKNAEFTLKYYDTIMDTDPEQKGVKAKAEWVLKTDEKGWCCLNENYKISGPDLYKMQDKTAALPIGTVTIQETKAPSGYRINPEKHVQWIKAEGTEEKISFYHETKIPENSIKLTLVKQDEITKTVLGEAGFLYTKPDGTAEQLVTDEQGQIVIKGLACGKHKIVENKPPKGYELNETEIIVTVNEKGEILAENQEKNSTNGVKITIQENKDAFVEVDEIKTSFKIKIHKRDDEKRSLPLAEFELYEDQECKEKIKSFVTDKKGEAEADNLQFSTDYYIKEVKAPKGYTETRDKKGNPVIYKIRAEQEKDGTVTLYVNNKLYKEGEKGEIYIEKIKGDTVANVTVINYKQSKLPATGSKGELMTALALIGYFTICLCCLHKNNY